MPHPLGQCFTCLLRPELAALVEDGNLEFENAFGTDVETMTRWVVPDLEMVSKTLLVAKAAGLLWNLVINCLAGEVPFRKAAGKVLATDRGRMFSATRLGKLSMLGIISSLSYQPSLANGAGTRNTPETGRLRLSRKIAANRQDQKPIECLPLWKAVIP